MENFEDSIYLNIANGTIKCIRIISDDKHYYINMLTTSETDSLYNQIVEVQTK